MTDSPSGSGPAQGTATGTAPPSTTPPGSAGASTAPPSSRPRADEFFDRLRRTGPLRPAEGRWVAGVCRGVSRRYDLDVVLVRGVAVVLVVVGGFGVLLYGLAWLFLPQDDGRAHAQQVLRGDVTSGFVGAAALTLLGLGSPGVAGDGPRLWGPLGVLAVVVLLVLLWTRGRSSDEPVVPPGSPAATVGTDSSTGATPGVPPTGSTPAGAPAWAPPPPPPVVPPRPDPSRASRRHSRGVLGVALLAAAAVLAWHRLVATLEEPGLVAACTALGVLGAGALAAGVQGRRSGAVAPVGVVLALLVLVAASSAPGPSAGDRTWRPTSVAEAADGYRLGVGEAVLDLRAPGLLDDATRQDPLRVDASVGAGELRVLVPDDVPVLVRGSVGLGELAHPVRSGAAGRGGDEGAGVERSVALGPAGAPVLLVDAQVGLGQLDVRSGPSADGTSPPATTPSAPASSTTTPSTPIPSGSPS